MNHQSYRLMLVNLLLLNDWYSEWKDIAHLCQNDESHSLACLDHAMLAQVHRAPYLYSFVYSQTTLLSIQDSKKTRNNSSTESINHSLRLRLTHAHIYSIGYKSGLYTGSQRILCPCCSNNSRISALL